MDFDTLLEKIQDEERRQTFAKLLEEEPQLAEEVKGGLLRQEEFSRKMNEISSQAKQAEEIQKKFEELEAQYKATKEELDQWNQWYEQAWDPEKKTTKAHAQALEELENARQKIEELESLVEAGDEMTLEDLNKRFDELIQQRGILTRQELERTGVVTADQLRRHLEMWGVSAEDFLAEFETTADRYKEEFGEVLDRKALLNFAREKGLQIGPAYEEFVREKREAVRKQREEEREKEIERKLEEARRQGEEEARKKLAMGENGRIPVDVGTPPEPGILEKRLQQEAMKNSNDLSSPEALKNVKLGQGILARAAAQELRQKMATNSE